MRSLRGCVRRSIILASRGSEPDLSTGGSMPTISICSPLCPSALDSLDAFGPIKTGPTAPWPLPHSSVSPTRTVLTETSRTEREATRTDKQEGKVQLPMDRPRKALPGPEQTRSGSRMGLRYRKRLRHHVPPPHRAVRRAMCAYRLLGSRTRCDCPIAP